MILGNHSYSLIILLFHPLFVFKAFMNFLNFLTSGTSLFNFQLQESTQTHNKDNLSPPQKIAQNSSKLEIAPNDPIQSQNEKMGEIPVNIGQGPLTETNKFLINQYLQLNIKYLTKQIQLQEKGPQSHQEKHEQEEEKEKTLNKKIKKVNKCGHPQKSHYAKGMCNNCYHKYGRTKKPWNCSHDKLYAGGMCQNCYINRYNRKKRESKNFNQEQKSKSEEQNTQKLN